MNFTITAVTENRPINKKINKINVGLNNEKLLKMPILLLILLLLSAP